MNFKKISTLLLIVLSQLNCFLVFADNSAIEQKEKNIELTTDNLIVLRGEVTPKNVANILVSVAKLNNIEDKDKLKQPIYLYLSTPGGNIDAGLELIEGIRGSRRTVHTITSFADSMGFQIVQNLGIRYILKNGFLMSHRAAGGFSGSFGGQKPSQFDSRYNFWLKRIEELDQQTVKRTNGKQTLDSYRAQYANEMWLTGTQSVNQGYADEIVTAFCNSSLNGTESKVIEFLGTPISYKISVCPLISGVLEVEIDKNFKNEKMDPVVLEKIKQLFIETQNTEGNI